MTTFFSARQTKTYTIEPHRLRGLATMTIEGVQKGLPFHVVVHITKCGQYKVSSGNEYIKINKAKLDHALAVARNNMGEKGLKIVKSSELLKLDL